MDTLSSSSSRLSILVDYKLIFVGMKIEKKKKFEKIVLNLNMTVTESYVIYSQSNYGLVLFQLYIAVLI